MTARSIRRAAERKSRKAAEKEARSQQSIAPQDEPALSSEAKIPKSPSTGPRTPEGKAVSSLNAVKTGLTGRTVLLPSDDAEAYRQHLTAYESEYRPVGLRETELVQSLADTQWRLQRILGLEMAIYARGRHEFAESYPEHELALRTSLIDLDVHLKYEKQLRNLQLQEARLHRRYEKEMAELRQLQEDRRAAAEQAPKFPPKAVAAGFVFSNPPERAQALSANPFAHLSPLDESQREAA